MKVRLLITITFLLTACGAQLGILKGLSDSQNQSQGTDPGPGPSPTPNPNPNPIPNPQPNPTYVQKVTNQMAKISINGVQATMEGELIANLAVSTPVESSFGIVRRGTILNILDADVDFIVYGNGAVSAAECDASPLDATYGPSHPSCQTYGVQNFDRIVICFANKEGANLTTAQNWPGAAGAFNDGLGLICYNNGVKMISTHVYSY